MAWLAWLSQASGDILVDSTKIRALSQRRMTNRQFRVFKATTTHPTSFLDRLKNVFARHKMGTTDDLSIMVSG